MKRLHSDHSRLMRICCDELPSGIDVKDLWKATTLGEPIGARSPELEKKWNLNPIDSIERVCEGLIKHANKLAKLESNQQGAPTRHKGAVPNSTINFLAWEMLVRCHHDGLTPHVALLNLVRFQLGVRSQQQADQEDVLAMKMEDASRFAFNNPNASLHKIAELYDVDISTVSRWNKKYGLRERGKMIQHMCDDIERQFEPMRSEVRKMLAKEKTSK